MNRLSSIGIFTLIVAIGCGDDSSGAEVDAAPEPDASAACTLDPDSITGEPANGDLSGTFAILTRYRAQIQGFGSDQIPRATFVAEIEQTGTDITITETICTLEVDAEDGSIEIRVTPDFIAALPTETRTGSIVDNGAGGYDVTVDMHYITRGVTLDDIANDEVPTDPADARIGDWDMDGKPGMTLLVGGLLTGQLHIVQRDFSMFSGTQTFADRVEGRSMWGSDQSYLGAEPPDLLNVVSSTIPDPDPSQHTFQIVRIPDGSGCTYVVDNTCDLFVDPDRQTP